MRERVCFGGMSLYIHGVDARLPFCVRLYRCSALFIREAPIPESLPTSAMHGHTSAACRGWSAFDRVG